MVARLCFCSTTSRRVRACITSTPAPCTSCKRHNKSCRKWFVQQLLPMPMLALVMQLADRVEFVTLVKRQGVEILPGTMQSLSFQCVINLVK